MKQSRLVSTLLTALALTTSVAATAYESGDIIFRAGPANADPDSSSSLISLAGSAIPDTEIQVGDDTQIGITATYMLTDQLGVGLLASTPFEHEITETGVGVNEIGTTKHLPPTLTLQYFPKLGGERFQPYVGAGLNYTTFFSEKTSASLNGTLGNASMSLDDSFGLALEVGADFALNEKWSINVAVWRVDIDTDAAIETDAGLVTVDVEIDPTVYMLGLAYKY